MHQNEISKLTAAEFLNKVTPRSPTHFGNGANNTFHMRNGLNELRRLKLKILRSLKDVLVTLCAQEPTYEEAIAALVRWEIDQTNGFSNNRLLSLNHSWFDKHLKIPTHPPKFPDLDSFSRFVGDSIDKPVFYPFAEARRRGAPIDKIEQNPPRRFRVNMEMNHPEKAQEVLDKRFSLPPEASSRLPKEILDSIVKFEASPEFKKRLYPEFQFARQRIPTDDLLKKYYFAPDISNVDIGKIMAIPDQTQSGHWYKGNAEDHSPSSEKVVVPPKEGGFVYIGGTQFFVNPNGTKAKVFDQDDNPSTDIVHPAAPLPEGHEYYVLGGGIGIRKIEDKK